MDQKSTEHWKYQKLTKILRAKISTVASGTRLPSIRALMKRYHLSMQTVNLAIRKLEEEKLVVRRRGSGIYVSDQRTMRFIVYHRSRHPSLNGDAKEISLLQAVQAAGWHLAVRRHDLQVEELTPEPLACAHVVNQDVILPEMAFLDQILRQSVPVVFMGREYGEYFTDYVTGDDRKTLLTLVSHFKELGHRHFGLLMNEPPLFEMTQRRQLMKEILKSMDLPEPCILECGTKWGEDSSKKAYDRIKKLIKNCPGRLPFSVLLVAAAEGGRSALRAFHEEGIAVPQQCSLATFGCSPENIWTTPSLTDAGLRVSQWGELIVELLKDRFAGDCSPNFGVKMSCHLNIRESSARAPRNFQRRRR